MRIDGAREEPIPFIEPDSTGERHTLFPFQVLPDQTRLLVVDLHGETLDLYAVDVIDRSRTLIMERDANGAYFAPHHHLLYLIESPGPLLARRVDPETLDLLGTTVVAVASDITNGYFSISQKGHFASVRRAHSGEYRLMVTDSSNVSRAVSDQTMILDYLRASQDERHIAITVFEYNGEYTQVVIFDRQTQAFNQLTSTDNNYAPAWSPDGKRIVFASDRDGSTAQSLYVRQMNGVGEAERIWQSDGIIDFVDWSPNGNEIIFTYNTLGQSKLWMYSFESGTAEPLPEKINGAGSQNRPRFSPNGEFIAYGSTENRRIEDLCINC